MEPETLLPDLAVIDAHHHLVDTDQHRYLHEELFRDLASGHRVTATVYVENRSRYRGSGDPAYRSVGETEFAARVAAMSASGQHGETKACLGIVAGTDLTLGAELEPVIDAHEAAGGGQLRGFRQLTFWDEDDRVWSHVSAKPEPGLLESAAFAAGARLLARRGLSLDIAVFHPQLPGVSALAARAPDLRVALNHMGLPLGVGGYANRRSEVFGAWRASMADLARHENVFVKVSGCGGALWGFDYDALGGRVDSSLLAEWWRPYMEATIELFGVDRCMFASNFPVDSRAAGYHELWNALKRIAAPYTADERAALCHGTAANVYRLPLARP